MLTRKSKAAILGLTLTTAVGFMLTACGPAKDAPSSSSTAPSAQTADKKTDARFQPLGAIPIPADNPMSAEKTELGRMLFFDNRLSGNNKTSCATCHSPGLGYGDGRPTFLGFEGIQGGRNAPTVINAGFYTSNFWDGRAKNLEEQALGPVQSPKEMNQKLDELMTELKAVPEYVERFKKVFNGDITPENLAKAIAAFERTIVVDNSDFDRYVGGDANALNPEAKRGLEVFAGKGQCVTCHSGPALSDNNFHNIGLSGDPGRQDVTKKDEDKGKFRTPGLRSISLTAPYMHNGSLSTLDQVVEYYNKGGDKDPNTDPLIKPLNLTDAEKADLVAFLKSLEGKPPAVTAPKLP